MDFVQIDNFRVRSLSSDSHDPANKSFWSISTCSNLASSLDKRCTSMDVEFDVSVEDILNRNQPSGPMGISGLNALWTEETERRKQCRNLPQVPQPEILLPLDGRENSMPSDVEINLLSRFFDIVENVTSSPASTTPRSVSDWLEDNSQNASQNLEQLIHLAEEHQDEDAVLSIQSQNSSEEELVASTPFVARSRTKFLGDKLPMSAIKRPNSTQEEQELEEVDELVFGSICEPKDDGLFDMDEQTTPTKPVMDRDLFLSQLDGANDQESNCGSSRTSRKMHYRPKRQELASQTSSQSIHRTPEFPNRSRRISFAGSCTPIRRMVGQEQEVISLESSSISDSQSHLDGIAFFDHSEFLIDSQIEEDTLTESSSEQEAVEELPKKSQLESSQEESVQQQSFIQLIEPAPSVSLSATREHLFQSASERCFLTVQQDHFTIASLEILAHVRRSSLEAPKQPLTWRASRKRRRVGRAPTRQDREDFIMENFVNKQKKTELLEPQEVTIHKESLFVDSKNILKTHGLTPTPNLDPVLCACLTVQRPYSCWLTPKTRFVHWILINEKDSTALDDRTWAQLCSKTPNRKFIQKPIILRCTDERELLNWIIYIVQANDPELLIGYEVDRQSWAYLVQRSELLGRAHFLRDLSRLAVDLVLCPHCSSCVKRVRNMQVDENVISPIHAKLERPEDKCVCSSWCAPQGKTGYGSRTWPSGVEGGRTGATFPCPGRVVLCLWRIIKHELSLVEYSFERVVASLLKEHAPRFALSLLQAWFSSSDRRLTLEYLSYRSVANLRILRELDLIARTSEFSRVFGIEFFHVLSRGTQYRVESVLLRLAKKDNLLLVSPSPLQRTKQRPPMELALNLEPEHRLFWDGPVAVLDFQSLYPSIAIAYNYCYSTCLGRLEDLAAGEDRYFKFGCLDLVIPGGTLHRFRDSVTISPCGIVFLRREVRESVLKRLWVELLSTRLMVKSSLRLHQENQPLKRLLDSRQLGLKLLANVIYGYTGASFTGRMACSEVADSIVSKARETLQRAIQLVQEAQRPWNQRQPARVVYGDTDSLFVFMPGRSKKEAFEQASSMVEAVNEQHPAPVTLKLEKVYYPCILEAKKRYAGFAYESACQKRAKFDAKGIEVVRRDSALFVGKMMTECFELVFQGLKWRSKKLKQNMVKLESDLRDLVLRWAHDVAQCRLSFADYLITRPYWGIDAYRPGSYSPALQVARRLVSLDPNAEPLVGERVAFYMAPGRPDEPLVSTVRSAQEAWCPVHWNGDTRGLERRSTYPALNIAYYLDKQLIPPLERMASLCGFNVKLWLMDIPRHNLPENRILSSRQNRLSALQSQNSLCMTPSTSKSAAANPIMGRFVRDGYVTSMAYKCINCGSMEGATNSEFGLSVCARCEQEFGADIARSCYVDVMTQLTNHQSQLQQVERVCGSCVGGRVQFDAGSRCSTRLAWNCVNLACVWHAKRSRTVQAIVQLSEKAPRLHDAHLHDW
ncbi:DNA polymerase zeta catalytic subunit [Cichlidogyrus casuarinus]|uniref:DNA polymerase n=1 Tax=Cichlidogyrus casuarinus TaxID=1844966 RepID=A0ABD2Q0F4_9PLAT